MRIILQRRLQDFAKKHADAANQILTWGKTVQKAKWKKGEDILVTYPQAKLIPSKRARFKIVGNKYRLVIEVDVNNFVKIRFIGTHAEYDKIDAATI